METFEILKILMACLGIAFAFMMGVCLCGGLIGNLLYWMCEELPNRQRKRD